MTTLNTRELNLLLLQLAGELTKAAERILQSTALTPTRSRVLGLLARTPDGALTTAEIARELGQSRQGVSLVVQRLASDELVITAGNPRHRRAFLVQISEMGRQVYRQANVRELDFTSKLNERCCRDGVAPSMEMLSRYSDAIQNVLAEEFPCAGQQL